MKKSLLKRIGTFLLVITMSLTNMSMTFAAENSTYEEASIEKNDFLDEVAITYDFVSISELREEAEISPMVNTMGTVTVPACGVETIYLTLEPYVGLNRKFRIFSVSNLIFRRKFMKKKTKILIIISILLIIVIFAFLFVINISKQYVNYNVTITKIENDYISVSFPIYRQYTYKTDGKPIYDSNGKTLSISDIKEDDEVYIDGEITNEKEKATVTKKIDNDTVILKAIYGYDFYTINIKVANNSLIKDINGNRISASELNVGDSLYIINKEEEFKPKMGELNGVKFIKILNNN